MACSYSCFRTWSLIDWVWPEQQLWQPASIHSLPATLISNNEQFGTTQINFGTYLRARVEVSGWHFYWTWKKGPGTSKHFDHCNSTADRAVAAAHSHARLSLHSHAKSEVFFALANTRIAGMTVFWIIYVQGWFSDSWTEANEAWACPSACKTTFSRPILSLTCKWSDDENVLGPE